MLEIEYLCGDVEICVVVDEGELVLAGQDGSEQVSNPDGPVPARPGQIALGVESFLPVTIVGGQILIGDTSVGAYRLVIPRAARAAQGFGVHGGAGGDQAGLDQWAQPVRDDRVVHPGGRAV